MASKFPKLSNWLFTNGFTSNVIKNIGGVHQNRTLPKVSIKSFSNTLQNINNQLTENYSVERNRLKNVLLFVDEFSNYLDVEIGVDSFILLTALGYKVEVIDTLDSGRALLSKGFLEEARVEAN